MCLLIKCSQNIKNSIFLHAILYIRYRPVIRRMIMSKVELLSDALDYIENNIYEDITADDVAKACYCSKSYLQKIFRYVNYCSIKEYIIKRRLTKAARDLVRDSTVSILDIALKYCYRSPEAFSRAFKQAWQCNPSVFRREARFTQLYPRQMVPIKNGDDYMSDRKQTQNRTEPKCQFTL